LYVKDISTLERTTNSLGLAFSVDPDVLESAKLALSNRKFAHKWEDISNQYGSNVIRGLITRLLADSIRKGKNASLVAPVASECLLDGISPIDIAILIRIRDLRGY